jgi:lactate dehydrogenase-like 2-hydroxyacid dehydrogenase
MNKFHKIAVIDVLQIPESAKKELENYSELSITFPNTDSANEDEVIKRIGQADAVLGSWKSAISKRIFDACPNIKYIGIFGTNLLGIDLAEAKRRGIMVTNVTDYADEATAEYVFWQLLDLFRGAEKYMWRSEPAQLYGKTIGIVGLGAVGKQVALRALGFKMKVIYYSKVRDFEFEKLGLEYCSLEELLKNSDIVTLHVPKDTVVLSKKEFSLMRSGTVLVDLCLGVVFNVGAFIEWMSKGENFSIFDKSKQVIADKIEILKNVIGLNNPVAALTPESREKLGRKAIDNLKDYLK